MEQERKQQRDALNQYRNEKNDTIKYNILYEQLTNNDNKNH